MPWRGPDYEGEFPSLGWELIDRWESMFVVPSGELAGEPLKLTDDQVKFFVRWYRVHPKTGRFVFRRGSRRGAKGRGKSPEGALYLAAEFEGPVVFDGWDANRDPVGKPRIDSLCWAAAVAEDQADNVYAVLLQLFGEAELPGVDVGKTRIEFVGRRQGKIETVTASAGAREGARVTACVLDETHLWYPSRGGDKLSRVIRRNVGKTGGRTLEVTNAPALGERSVAESTLEAFEKGQRGLLYDSVEASWDDDLDPKARKNRHAVIRTLKQAYDGVTLREGGWIDIERVYEECMDVDTPRDDILRFYFNLARKAANRVFDSKQFKACGLPGVGIGADEPCVLMFDGARTRDCAVLSAWSLGDVPHHVGVKVWERPFNPDAGYEHPRGEIYGEARDFIAAHDVVMFAYDSSFHEIQSMYDDWLDEYGEAGKDGGLMLGYPTASGKRMEPAIKRLVEDMRTGKFTHDGDEQIAAHMFNAVLARNRGGWQMLAKEKDSMKIDGAVTFTFGYDLIPAARELATTRKNVPSGFAFVMGGD